MEDEMLKVETLVHSNGEVTYKLKLVKENQEKQTENLSGELLKGLLAGGIALYLFKTY